MIPNQTPLSSLEERVEQAVNERMVPFLLANELKRHTRRGVRFGCDCEYCKVKRTPIFVYPSELKDYSFLEVESRVHLARQKQISVIRDILNAIKSKVSGERVIKNEKITNTLHMVVGKSGSVLTFRDGASMYVNLFQLRNTTL